MEWYANFENVLKRHMDSKEFMGVLYNGSQFLIYHENGETVFKAWGVPEHHRFTTFRSDVFMADIVCGALDVMGVRYELSRFAEDKEIRKPSGFAIRELPDE